MTRYYIPARLPSLPPLSSPTTHLLASLSYILTNYPHPTPFHHHRYCYHGLYYGPTSISILFLRLSSVYPDLKVRGKRFIDWAREYLSPSPAPSEGVPKGVSPRGCGVGAEMVVRMVVQAVMTRDEELAGWVCTLGREVVLVEDEAASDEWLYGRAGYLYLLRVLRGWFADGGGGGGGGGWDIVSTIDSTIKTTADTILSKHGVWLWHGRAYLGAVHGSIGILTQLVLSYTLIGTPPPKDLEIILSHILNQQFDSGNWPSSETSTSGDKLVQLCHGASGFVLSLATIRDAFPGLHAEIDPAIDLARETISSRGFLKKDPCLCHGVTGNALALMACAGGEAEAEGWLAWTTRDSLDGEGGELFLHGDEDSVDEEMGLWTGEAGRAWSFAMMDQISKGNAQWKGTLLGYNDL